MASGEECEFTQEPDKVQAPTATAPGVVSPTMPVHLSLPTGFWVVLTV